MAERQIILGTGSRVQSFPCAFPSSTDVPVRLLNQLNRSWQRRSFAKSNDRGKVGLHFVPKCNHAHKSHTSQYNIEIYFGLLRSRNFPTMAKQQKWLLSIARVVYIIVPGALKPKKWTKSCCLHNCTCTLNIFSQKQVFVILRERDQNCKWLHSEWFCDDTWQVAPSNVLHVNKVKFSPFYSIYCRKNETPKVIHVEQKLPENVIRLPR